MKYTELKRLLVECAVNPNDPESRKWKVFADINNYNYYKSRAIECIMNSEISDPDENLKLAITMLSMARWHHHHQGVTEKKPKSIERFE